MGKDFFENLELAEAVQEVCTCPTAFLSLGAFQFYGPLLKGWRFILEAETGNQPGYAVNKKFSNKGAVFGLFNKVLVIDKDTVADMSRRKEFKFDYSISLDTMALSYVEPFLLGRGNSIPGDFKEVFDYLASPGVNFDATPYLNENTYNALKEENWPAIRGKLLAYEVLRTLDEKRYARSGEIKSVFNDRKVRRNAEELFVSMVRRAQNKEFINSLYDRYMYIYCALVKMAELRLTPTSPQKRFLLFIRWMDEEMSALWHREIIIASKLLLSKQPPKFFWKSTGGERGHIQGHFQHGVGCFSYEDSRAIFRRQAHQGGEILFPSLSDIRCEIPRNHFDGATAFNRNIPDRRRIPVFRHRNPIVS